MPAVSIAVPELPEVEVLVRNLGPLLKNKTIREVRVFRPKVLAPTRPGQLARALLGRRFLGVSRRGKYLLFALRPAAQRAPVLVVGHLGMTGRMYLQLAGQARPRHSAVLLGLGREDFIFEDTRYFGRFTLDARAIERLGPEPLEREFTVPYLTQGLRRSSQAVKVKLLDQRLVAGMGNIYASEALFEAGISPRLPARRLTEAQIARLWRAIRKVLAEAIEWGSTVPLNYPGTGRRNRLFYFGTADGAGSFRTERLRMYDRAGQPCPRCGANVKRLVQAGRSTYYCPVCQLK